MIMNFINYITVLLLFLFLSTAGITQEKYAIVIHGGAGVISRSRMTPEKEKQYREKLGEALDKGEQLLKAGMPAVDVVVEVIAILEDSPLFNAGKGAVFTADGHIELDASIMEGKTMMAGAVAGVKTVKNPIKAAREVMLHSEHVMLSGKGADEFARKQGLEIVKNSYFKTKERYEALKKARKEEKNAPIPEKHGTVGCVALDTFGNICAGTSTGGMTNKKYGRIGDSPVIGAGTFASNNTCGVSSTGHGEYFIRLSVAKDISALMEYKNLPLDKASSEVIGKLTQMGGTGGVIALDRFGNVAMPFNTPGMFRGYIKSNGEKKIAIFENE